jgi:ADP-ribose pyrophosphatase YjhB (NUDIX family)
VTTFFERAETAVSRLPTPARRRAIRVGYVALKAWWFVRRPNTEGVKVVLRRGEDVLLVRHAYGRRAEWDLPGGFMGTDEPPEEAVLRELEEELGVRAQSAVALGKLLQRCGGKRDTIHAFATDVDGGPLVLDEAEIAEARWFGHEALPDETTPLTRRLVARAYWELFRE